MIKNYKLSIIVLLSLVAFKMLISAEDEDDLALEKINKLFIRYPRMIAIENLNDFEKKRELESKLNQLLNIDHRSDIPKFPVVRENNKKIKTTTFESDDSTTMKEKTDSDDEIVEDDEEEEDDEEDEERTESPKKRRTKAKHIFHKIRHKLMDKKTKFTISLPVAIIIFGSTIFVTCCCSLYLRNRLVACANKLTGKKKRKSSKMLTVDSERGRSLARTKKKLLSTSKNRARSLSQDLVNIATQKNSAITTSNETEEASNTGCCRCCKKKKKRENKYKK